MTLMEAKTNSASPYAPVGQKLSGGTVRESASCLTCSQKVDANNNNYANRDPQRIEIRILVPEVDQHRGSTQFCRKNDSPIIPVVPAHSEREGSIDKTLGQLDVASGYGEVCNHFSEGYLGLYLTWAIVEVNTTIHTMTE